ncbi:MAG: hypothetical protein AAFQ41_16580 [Cyanobacteria bacterium J06623_7]
MFFHLFSQFLLRLVRLLLIKLIEMLAELLLSKFWQWFWQRYGQPLLTRIKQRLILIYLWWVLNFEVIPIQSIYFLRVSRDRLYTAVFN